MRSVPVTARWFLLNRPELRERIIQHLNALGRSDFEVVDDLGVAQGQDKDPFIGVLIKNPHLPGAPWEGRLSDEAVVIAVGCSGAIHGEGEPGDAYILDFALGRHSVVRVGPPRKRER